MSDRREADLREWIQAAAAATRTIELEEILDGNRAPADLTSSEPRIVVDLEAEEPVTNRRNLYLAIAAALGVLALGTYALNRADGTTSAANRDDATTTTTAAETTTSTSTVSTSRTEMATAFWQALAAGDKEQALSLVDPVERDSPAVPPHGRAFTLEGQFDWYDAVGWEWQLSTCEAETGAAPTCTVSASNAWSEALGIEPIAGRFRVSFSDDGIIRVTDTSGSFSSRWSQQAFEPFASWVQENHPDDAEVMFDFDTDVNDEILDLYEINTTRFVESQTQ